MNFASGVKGEAVHFYGNSGVCVFKYLVTDHDPQRWFTISVLILNFICFIIISISYITINAKTIISSKTLAGPQNRELANRNRKLQLKVSVIILTDFLCWVPFTIVCFLHYVEFIDATLWYPLFSSIILPINSVINPLLYDAILGEFLFRPFKASYKTVHSAISSMKGHTASTRGPAADDYGGLKFEMNSKSGIV